MYVALALACVALFWLLVPLLLAARVRSIAPWWFVIASATAIGWILTNAAVFFQHRAVDEAYRQELLCFNNASHEPKDVNKHAGVSIGNGVYETAVDNPCGIGTWIKTGYKPFAGFIYGPLYLLCCSLPYWLISGRRSSLGLTRQIAWLAVGALLIEWTAIVGECIRPGYLGGMCTNADPYIWPPLTIVAALLTSWAVTTQLLQRFARRA